MHIESHARRRRPISVTSLIDVIFLLLLFFMLSSTFTRFSEVEFTGGRAGVTTASARPDVLIRISDDGWAVNGERLDEDAALTELSRLQQASAKTAVVLVRGAMSSQALVSAVEQIRRETALTLSVAR